MQLCIIVIGALMPICFALPELLAPPASDTRTIELGPSERKQLTADQVMQLHHDHVNFMDITDSFITVDDQSAAGLRSLSATRPLPSTLRAGKQVRYLQTKLSTKRMKLFLAKLTSFYTRYYDSDWGLKASDFLFNKLQGIAAKSGKKISVRKVKHSFKQNSVIARIEPLNSTANDAVIMGAHLDSVNWDDITGRSPGADDDGSACAVLLEILRVLAFNKDYQPTRPLEFHWYSGEEDGLLGSQQIAGDYYASKRPVYAMLELDMEGFVTPEFKDKPHFGVFTDYTDPDMVKLFKQLITEYTEVDFVESQCGYACSDHASWYKAGYRSIVISEGTFEEALPEMHTAEDSLDKINWDHVYQCAKLVLSFAVELGQV